MLMAAYTKIPHGIEHWGNSVWAFYYIAIVVWKVMIVAGFEIENLVNGDDGHNFNL
jgi:hypothetical protein